MGHKAYAHTTIEKYLKSKYDLEITFKEEETDYLDPNYDDSLVVFVRMINAQVKKVIIDIGSSFDIL